MRLQGRLEKHKTGVDEREHEHEHSGVNRCHEVRLPFNLRESPSILAWAL